MTATGRQGHAVVLGGSISGLFAARALTDRFARVTIVERDVLAAGFDPRKATPQGAHVHALLARGREIAERFLPGATKELVDGGAVLAGIEDARIYVCGWRKPYDGADQILSMTRPFFEWTLARRVVALPGVSVLEKTEATALTHAATRATGIVVRDANGEREVAADLIVDARGRASNLADWMKAAGFEPPPHETSPLASVYCSYLGEPAPGSARPKLHQIANFEEKIGVLIFPVERGRVLVSLGANAKVALPKTHDEMLAFLKTLPVPNAYDAAKTLTPVTPLAFSRFTASVRRNFDALSHPPDGIVAIGDAVASFNPIFGQGMTVAAIEAEWLADCLKQNDPAAPGFAKAYYAGLKPIVDIAWGAPDLEAKRNNPKGQNWPTRFMLWYTERMQRAATRSVVVSKALMRVQNMMAPPTLLFSPGIFIRVLFA